MLLLYLFWRPFICTIPAHSPTCHMHSPSSSSSRETGSGASAAGGGPRSRSRRLGRLISDFGFLLSPARFVAFTTRVWRSDQRSSLSLPQPFMTIARRSTHIHTVDTGSAILPPPFPVGSNGGSSAFSMRHAVLRISRLLLVGHTAISFLVSSRRSADVLQALFSPCKEAEGGSGLGNVGHGWER